MLLGDVLKGDLGASVSNPAAQLAQGPGFAIKGKKKRVVGFYMAWNVGPGWHCDIGGSWAFCCSAKNIR